LPRFATFNCKDLQNPARKRNILICQYLLLRGRYFIINQRFRNTFKDELLISRSQVRILNGVYKEPSCLAGGLFVFLVGFEPETIIKWFDCATTAFTLTKQRRV
jgi:hypothetical protein